MTKQQEVVVTNSEKYQTETWDAFFTVCRGRIEQVCKAEPGQHQSLNAQEIGYFRGCISALTVFKFSQPILLEKSKDLLALVSDICAYCRSNVGTRCHSLIALLEVYLRI
jgi:hypothetical protein